MTAAQGRDAERDAILAALTPVVDGIAATFGPVCEVVLHDYRRPEESVVAVAGTVTGRTVGGAMSEIGMRVLARGDEAADELNYLTRTGDGTLVKSSTMVLRDSTGAVFGALCVNVDVTAVGRAHTLLGVPALCGRHEHSSRPVPPTFLDYTSKRWILSPSAYSVRQRPSPPPRRRARRGPYARGPRGSGRCRRGSRRGRPPRCRSVRAAG